MASDSIAHLATMRDWLQRAHEILDRKGYQAEAAAVYAVLIEIDNAPQKVARTCLTCKHSHKRTTAYPCLVCMLANNYQKWESAI